MQQGIVGGGIDQQPFPAAREKRHFPLPGWRQA
jgi:hypothetical protein